MVKVGSSIGYFGHQLRYLKKKNIMSTPNVQCGHNIRQKDSHYH